MNFAPKLVRAARNARGYSQAKVAEDVGVTPQSIINIERGHVIPRVTLVGAIAALLGVPVDDFFEKETEGDDAAD